MTAHIDTLKEWWENAERGAASEGDTVIWRNQRHRSGAYAYEVGRQDRDEAAALPDYLRILSRAPKPKPAWRDADFIVARYENDDHWQGYLRSGDLWIDSEGQKYTTGVLRDVIPLIEAKVTDEMIDRILDVIDARFDNYPAGIGEELAVAALGIEAE